MSVSSDSSVSETSKKRNAIPVISSATKTGYVQEYIVYCPSCESSTLDCAQCKAILEEITKEEAQVFEGTLTTGGKYFMYFKYKSDTDTT
jgi:hypothetical protein